MFGPPESLSGNPLVVACSCLLGCLQLPVGVGVGGLGLDGLGELGLGGRGAPSKFQRGGSKKKN